MVSVRGHLCANHLRIRLSVRSVCLSCDASTSAECSEGVCWSLLLWSCSSFAAGFMESSCSFSRHQPVLDLALSSGALAPATFVARSHRCSSPYLSRPHKARPAPRRVAARECPHREALGKDLSLLRAVSSELLCRCRRFTTTPSITHFFVEASLPRECLAHFACSPGRRRLDVSSRARGTCFLSPLRCLAFVAVPTQCPPRPGSCPSPRHRSSCLFMNCLFGQLDTVGVSARPRVNVLHWQRS